MQLNELSLLKRIFGLKIFICLGMLGFSASTLFAQFQGPPLPAPESVNLKKYKKLNEILIKDSENVTLGKAYPVANGLFTTNFVILQVKTTEQDGSSNKYFVRITVSESGYDNGSLQGILFWSNGCIEQGRALLTQASEFVTTEDLHAPIIHGYVAGPRNTLYIPTREIVFASPGSIWRNGECENLSVEQFPADNYHRARSLFDLDDFFTPPFHAIRRTIKASDFEE